MSGNTSQTGGYLQSTTTSPYDDALSAAFQSMVVSLTGLDPTLVRPRWQPQPPTQPPVTTDWCAIGVTAYEPYDFPAFSQDTDTAGTLHRLERINLLATFYGPNSTSFASMLRDGLYVHQNYDTLAQQGLKLRSADNITYMPELINSQFVPRSDLPMSFMRMVDRSQPVSTIASAQVSFQTDDGLACVETIQETP